MITQSTLQSTLPYSLMLDSAGIALSPVRNTPLAALAAAAAGTPGMIATSGTNVVYIDDLAMLTNTTEHSDMLSALVENIAPTCREHIRFAQTVVNPTVTALLGRVEEVSKYFVSSQVSGLEVRRVRLVEPLTIPNLVSVIDSYATANLADVMQVRVFPILDAAQLLEMLKTGNDDVDEVIAKWYYGEAVEVFENVWASFFSSGYSRTKGRPYMLDKIKWDSPLGCTIALATFMWCNRLYDNPIEGMDYTQGATQRSLNNYLNDMRAYMANRLNVVIALAKERERSKQLIASTDAASKAIYVNEEIYLKWLSESDGNNEILYGVLLTGDMVTLTADIDRNKERYLSAFYKYTDMANISAKVNWGVNMRRAMIDCINEQICNSDLSQNAKTMAYTQVSTIVTRYGDDQLKNDLYNVCLEIMHTLLFPGTASLVILRGINEANRDNSRLTVREAATVSFLRYVVRYVAGLITVGSAKTGAM